MVISLISTGIAGNIETKAATEKEEISAIQTAGVNTSDYGLADNIQDGVILHCFDWKYNDIKAELPNIAEAGFTSVQTSPAQPGGGSGIWWWLYQPLGFYVGTNELGTKEDLKALCEEAEKYGIKVVVDVVANHLAGSHTNIQNDLKASQYWHTYGTVNSWADRYQVTHGEIGMPDLNSEDSYVQQCVSKYIDELKGIGVDGIRWDAAKHIGLPSESCGFWPAVTKQGLYHYGEILVGPDDRQSGNEGLMKEYTNYMTVTDSTYGKTLRDSFNSGQAPSSYGNWAARGISNNKLIYWSESHDTWSNNKDWGYSNGMSQNVIDRGYAVAASRNNISALYFSRPASTVKDNIKIGQKGSTHFTSPEVAAVNHFHNAMIGQKDYYTASNGCSVVCREQGAVIVKGSGSGQVSVKNGGSTTAPGTYIDEITGNEWTVTKDTISGTIGSSGIAVVYNPKPAGPSASVTPGTTSYSTDTLTLTLNYKNATSGQYAVDGGEYKTFADGDTITIGEDADYGTQTKVSVKASDDSTTSEEQTYTYTKTDPNQTQKIYFDNAAYKWSSVYCYIYTENGTTAKYPAKWPGTKMTQDAATGYYVMEVPEGFENGRVIFTESEKATTNRYPADQKPGLSLGGTTKVFKENHTLEEYNPPTATKKPVTEPTKEPEETPEPTSEPTEEPTDEPVATPTCEPTSIPTAKPTEEPTDEPAATPTCEPTSLPTAKPTEEPTKEPEATPTNSPTANPTATPTMKPTIEPTITPTMAPTASPTVEPTTQPLTFSKLSYSKASPQLLGETVKFTVKATGGDGNYQYKFDITDSSGKIVTTRKWSKTSYYNWKATKAGTYSVYVSAREGSDNTTSISSGALVYKILPKLTIKSLTIDKQKKGWKLKAEATGGQGTKKYYFYVKNSKGKTIKLSSAYSKKATYLWKNVKKGTYTVYVKVKDSTGTKTRAIKVKIKE